MFLQVLVAVNEAIPGPWIKLIPPNRPDTWKCATAAAKVLKGHFAFVKRIWWAGGRVSTGTIKDMIRVIKKANAS